MNNCRASYTVCPTVYVEAGSFYGNGFRGTIGTEYDFDVIKISVNAREGGKDSVQINLDRPEWLALRAFVDAKIAESDAQMTARKRMEDAFRGDGR